MRVRHPETLEFEEDSDNEQEDLLTQILEERHQDVLADITRDGHFPGIDEFDQYLPNDDLPEVNLILVMIIYTFVCVQVDDDQTDTDEVPAQDDGPRPPRMRRRERISDVDSAMGKTQKLYNNPNQSINFVFCPFEDPANYDGIVNDGIDGNLELVDRYVGFEGTTFLLELLLVHICVMSSFSELYMSNVL